MHIQIILRWSRQRRQITLLFSQCSAKTAAMLILSWTLRNLFFTISYFSKDSAIYLMFGHQRKVWPVKKLVAFTRNIAHFPIIMSSKGFNGLIIIIQTLVCTRQRVKRPLPLSSFLNLTVTFLSFCCHSLILRHPSLSGFFGGGAVSLISSYAQAERSPDLSKLFWHFGQFDAETKTLLAPFASHDIARRSGPKYSSHRECVWSVTSSKLIPRLYFWSECLFLSWAHSI